MVAAGRLKAAEFIQVTWIPVPFGYVGGLLIGSFINIKELVLPTEEETAIAK